MSRIRQEISSVQFQVDARKANASMEALQEKARELNNSIETTKADIAALGNVSPDDANLLKYQKALRELSGDLNDVTAAQRDLVKGVKAAYQLWKAAEEGNIENLSVKSIKAGQRGLQQRMQNLQPGDKEDAKVLRAYKAAIEEADITILKFQTDAANTLKILDEGGSVSAKTMRETRDRLKDLVDITPTASAEYKEFKSQLEQMEARMSSLSENERRLAGEIVTVADAMKMANASTREAAEQRLKDAAAAKQQAETERATLETQREASRLKIETAEKEAASIKEQITEQEKLVKSQEALYEASDRADKEVDEARKKRDAARESTKQYTDAITTAANKVADLKKQLDELNGTPVKPQVDTSELDRLKAKLESIEREIKEAEAESGKWEKGGPEGFLSDEQIKQEIIKRTQKFYAEQLGQPLRQESISIMQQMPMSELLKEGYSGKLRQFDVFSDLESMWKTRQGAIDDRIKKIDGLRQKYNDVVQEIEKLNAAQQKATQANHAEGEATSKLTQLQEEYNAKVSIRIQKEKELKEIQSRSFKDEPEIQRLNTEIAKLEELIAVSEKYKKQFTQMSDKKFEEGYMGKTGIDDERTSSYRAENYLKRAYHDRLKASVADHPLSKDDPSYQEAAKRVAGGIVQNAQENLRRAIYAEIKDGKLTSSAIEERIKGYRNQMAIAAHDANGSLKDDPEYNTYKYIIAQMEKYLEVAKQVEAERAKIAGGSPFLELAKEKSVLSDAPQEGLTRQKESREFEEATGGSDAINRRKEQERIKSEEVAQAKRDEETAEHNLNEEKKKSAEVTKQLADAQAELDKATKDAEEPKKKLAKAEDDLTEAEKKQTKAYEDLNTAREKQDFAGQNEKLDQLEHQYDELTGSIEKEKQAITENATAAKEAYDKETEAAIEMAQAQNYSQKSMEDSIALLEKQSKVETDTKKYKEMTTAIETMQQRVKEMTGEWMSYAEAEKYAESIGTDGFIATSDQLQKATQSLTRYKDTLIKTIQQKRDDGKATAEEEAELKKVEAELKKMKFEMDNANMSSKRMHEILKDPKSAKNIEELSAAIKRSTQELKLMEETIGKDNAKYKEMAEQTKKATIEQKNMEAQFKASAGTFEKAWSRLKTYVGLYVGAAVAMQKIVATMGDLMELSDKMGEVRKTTGFSADEVGRLSDNLMKLDVRTSLTSLMELSSLAGSVGLKTQQDVQGFTEAANQLMIALPEMGNESARTLIKIAQATGDLQKNNNDVRETLEKVGSTIIALRANSASAAGPITDFVSRVGAVGAQAGISIDQIAAMGSTIDALGGRVEMSATALSRMIPAIRNNSYAIANSIGVTESYLKSLSAMDQMVLIFQKLRDSIKGINTETEEGQQQMADNIEAVLGKNAVMAEVMKDLNQQGARAGIVFGLLSQNVDELQKQLGIAGEAYRDNIALQEEFNKMNDTTAAKWERLKNQLEEMFVRDWTQRQLGGLIDMLRKLVVWIAADGPIVKGLKVITTYAIAMKLQFGATFASMGGAFRNFNTMLMAGVNVFATAMGGAINAVTGTTNSMRGLRAATIGARREWTKMDAAMKANVIGAVIAAIGMLVYKIYDWIQASKAAAAEIGRFNQQLHDEKKALDDLFTPLKKSNLAQDERSKLISEINSKYGKYLGYMLSETDSAIRLADAHALIAKRIREEAYEKRILDQENSVRGKYEEDMNVAYAGIVKQVRKAVKGEADAQEISDILKDIVDKNINKVSNVREVGDIGGGRIFDLDPAFAKQLSGKLDRLVLDGKISRENVSLINGAVSKYILQAKDQYDAMQEATQVTRSDLRNVQRSIKGDVNANLNDLTDKLRNFGKRTNEQGVPLSIAKPDEQSEPTWEQRMGERPNWTGNANVEADTQIPLPSWKPNLNKENIEEVKEFVKAQDDLRGYLKANAKDITEDARKTAEMYLVSETEITELRRLIADNSAGGGTSGGGGGGRNPYGDFNRVTSPYGEWDADSLVNRRKEMLERVRSLANGADVQKVLSEDAKFISEAVRNNIKTTEQAIEWYNNERLKIQDALHAKHLTNTGDWMDPTKKKAREKTLKDEWKAYFDELDAYYTERKTRIQEAANEEGITEAEARNRMQANEAEWRQRRAELGLLYADKAADVTREEMQAIFDIIAERTDDSADMVEKTLSTTVDFMLKIGKKSPEEMRKYLGKLDKQTEVDWLKQQQALHQHLKAIQDIIDKERPFNGITKNLRENLVTMDILTADMREEYRQLMKAGADMSDFNARQAAEEMKRTSFLLGEAEYAYQTTAEDVMRRMEKAGMKAWADEIRQSPEMQQAMMAQLRSTYDAIQEAIKKEASIIKKQMEIFWNDVLKGQKSSLKDQWEEAISIVGEEAEAIKRANELIGAGYYSERVADKWAIKQMQLQLAMQQHYYSLQRKIGAERLEQIEQLKAAKKAEAERLRVQAEQLKLQGKITEANLLELKAKDADRAAEQAAYDAKHLQTSNNLAATKEGNALRKQELEINKAIAETRNKLYKELKEYTELITTDIRGVFEAMNTGNRDYFNEKAKMDLQTNEPSVEGKDFSQETPYIIIENEGTKDATASYEYLNEKEALDRKHEIEVSNATKDAWRKLLDDLNAKMGEKLTDMMNAALQDDVTERNTEAIIANTEALKQIDGSMQRESAPEPSAETAKETRLQDMALKDKTFEVKVNTAKAMEDLMAIDKVQIPDKVIHVRFENEAGVKLFQSGNQLKVDGIIGPKTLAKLEKLGATRISDKSFGVDVSDEKAVANLSKIKGLNLEDKEINVVAHSEEASAKLAEMGATKIDDKTFKVNVDTLKAINDLHKIQNIEIPPLTVEVRFDSKKSVSAFQRLSQFEQVGTVGPKTTGKLNRFGAEKAEDETFSVETVNAPRIKGIVPVGGTQKVTVDSVKGLKDILNTPGLELPAKEIAVKANTAEAEKKLESLNAKKLEDMTFSINIENPEVLDKLMALDLSLLGGVKKDVPVEVEVPTPATNKPIVTSSTATKQAKPATTSPVAVAAAPVTTTTPVAKVLPTTSPSVDNAAAVVEADVANTEALDANTQAMKALTEAVAGKGEGEPTEEMVEKGESILTGREGLKEQVDELGEYGVNRSSAYPSRLDWTLPEEFSLVPEGKEDEWEKYQDFMIGVLEGRVKYHEETSEKLKQIDEKENQERVRGAQSAFAKMASAMNLYSAAYQAMSNDNMKASQRWEMFAVQVAGQAAMSMLTADFAKAQSDQTIRMPGILGKLFGEMPYPAAIATFAAITALMGGLMGMAASRVTKSKSEIAQATGASTSASAGRLATGMLTYAEGNVNEFTDPSSLTPGKQYNVDAADGKTYRAKYMGKGAKTHITNGPEFHLVGEKGREAIIDAGTTRQITMNEPEIWRSIQTLYNGGSLSTVRRRGRGVRAFADGNLEEIGDAYGTNETNGAYGIDMAAMTEALNRQSAVQEALLERLSSPIKAEFNVFGPKGLIDSYDTGKKTVLRHGQRY